MTIDPAPIYSIRTDLSHGSVEPRIDGNAFGLVVRRAIVSRRRVDLLIGHSDGPQKDRSQSPVSEANANHFRNLRESTVECQSLLLLQRNFGVESCVNRGAVLGDQAEPERCPADIPDRLDVAALQLGHRRERTPQVSADRPPVE